MGDVVVRPLAPSDLSQVATIHVRAFQDSAITAFGDDFVTRYYRWLLDSQPGAALTGAFVDARLRGFCAAGVFRDALNGFLRKERARIALALLKKPTLFASPLIRDRIKTGLAVTVRFSRLRIRRNQVQHAPSFGVLAIATDPTVRGSGCGRALMLDAEERARRSGFDRMNLTVHPANTRAVQFYEQLGWHRTVADAGEWSGRMYKPLATQGGPA